MNLCFLIFDKVSICVSLELLHIRILEGPQAEENCEADRDFWRIESLLVHVRLGVHTVGKYKIEEKHEGLSQRVDKCIVKDAIEVIEDLVGQVEEEHEDKSLQDHELDYSNILVRHLLQLEDIKDGVKSAGYEEYHGQTCSVGA